MPRDALLTALAAICGVGAVWTGVADGAARWLALSASLTAAVAYGLFRHAWR